jgi:hypothetical protein
MRKADFEYPGALLRTSNIAKTAIWTKRSLPDLPLALMWMNIIISSFWALQAAARPFYQMLSA